MRNKCKFRMEDGFCDKKPDWDFHIVITVKNIIVHYIIN